MKIRVSYKQKELMGLYEFIRVIDFTPDRRLFKNKTEQNVVSNARITNEEYVKKVREVLNYTNEELKTAIQPVLDDYVYDPIYISYDISQYNSELEIQLDNNWKEKA